MIVGYWRADPPSHARAPTSRCSRSPPWDQQLGGRSHGGVVM
ncbi:hypothetical protein DB30_08067 [Enhygromyxa salina]|uniref:Uncharacterized protein n=1 Tax=Enhygromyxa salina TaxID=215803 RepID=A0A0C2CV29_9BACT|nr:hypothetical protein DB30_08067 [Enhygromyxa salina]